MVNTRLPDGSHRAQQRRLQPALNHVWRAHECPRIAPAAVPHAVAKILGKLRLFEFSENLRRIRLESGKKRRGCANLAFKCACYGGANRAASIVAKGTKGSVMFFLLRVAFWLSIVVILLPTGQSQPSGPGPQLSAVDAVSAAGAAVSDLRQFCGRQPDACAVGGQAAVAFGHKAQASAKMLYEFLTERLGPNDTSATDASATGSIAARRTSASVPLPVAAPRRSQQTDSRHTRSQHTLTPPDLAPAWRGPAPRMEAQFRYPA